MSNFSELSMEEKNRAPLTDLSVKRDDGYLICYCGSPDFKRTMVETRTADCKVACDLEAVSGRACDLRDEPANEELEESKIVYECKKCGRKFNDDFEPVLSEGETKDLVAVGPTGA